MKGKLLSRLKDQNLTRLWRLKPQTKILTDFYVLDVETAHRPKHGTIFKDSRLYQGVLKWQLKATPESFVFGVLYGRNYTKVIHSIREFRETLLEPRFKNRIIFAHNGGNYDYPCIYGNPYDVDPEAIFNGKFISFTNGNCTFADSINIFVGLSIKAIGAMNNNSKLGMSRNYSKSHWPKDYARDVKGCIKDCEILYDALLSTFEFAGDIKITQASLSMAYYRRYHQPFHIDHNENTKHFWSSYYGGRTECFKIGRCHASVIDVNSMYPYHLRNAVFPNPKTLKLEHDISDKRLFKYMDWFEGMADCTIIHHSHDYGFLPVKHEEKLIFPTGEFRGSWNFPELRFALKHGVIKIVKVHRVVYGERMESPFKSFVDTLHDIKLKAQKEGDKWRESMVKYYLNMLYGKFGQRIEEECIYIKDVKKQFHVIEEYQRKGLFKRWQPFSSERLDGFLYIGRKKKKATPYAIPSFASYVTSYGRVQLLDGMLSNKGNNVVYCDTDSQFIESTHGIVSSKELGGWKLEDKIVTEIKGLKNYRYVDVEKGPDEIWRVKGVPSMGWIKEDGKWTRKRKTVKLFEGFKEYEFPSVQQVSDNKFEYWNLMKPREALKRGKRPGVLTKRVKVIKGTYDKRIVLTDGNTKPIEI